MGCEGACKVLMCSLVSGGEGGGGGEGGRGGGGGGGGGQNSNIMVLLG